TTPCARSSSPPTQSCRRRIRIPKNNWPPHTLRIPAPVSSPKPPYLHSRTLEESELPVLSRFLVGNDDDARWRSHQLHRTLRSTVDLHTRLRGDPLFVVGARTIELPIAQHNAALGENGALQFGDGPCTGSIRQLPCNGLGKNLRRSVLPCCLDHIPVA